MHRAGFGEDCWKVDAQWNGQYMLTPGAFRRFGSTIGERLGKYSL